MIPARLRTIQKKTDVSWLGSREDVMHPRLGSGYRFEARCRLSGHLLGLVGFHPEYPVPAYVALPPGYVRAKDGSYRLTPHVAKQVQRAKQAALEGKKLSVGYQRRLTVNVREWLEKHPEGAKAMEAEVKRMPYLETPKGSQHFETAEDLLRWMAGPKWTRLDDPPMTVLPAVVYCPCGWPNELLQPSAAAPGQRSG